MKAVYFGVKVRELRTKALLTQEQLASRSGLNPCAISHFETGNRSPSLKNIIKLCVALNCTPNELIWV